MKRIGVLTSGGDAPGMNAAVRAVVRAGLYYGLEVYGIKYGYRGLIEDVFEKMDAYSVADIIQKGGTVLRTARCMDMMNEEGMEIAVQRIKEYELDALVVIGGNGTYAGAQKLAKRGINVVAIPGTIDNDIPSSDFSIGFDTAVNTVVDAISKIRDTSFAHNRANVVEVMGRACGHIALTGGMAGGAESIIIPEIEYDLDAICEKMVKGKDRGKLHSIIVLSEGAGKAQDICKQIEEKTGVTTRATILGYIQRGGSPTSNDRNLASKMGVKAVQALIAGKKNRAMCSIDGKIVDIDIEDALLGNVKIDEDLYNLANILSV